jgi:hypothetical protein
MKLALLMLRLQLVPGTLFRDGGEVTSFTSRSAALCTKEDSWHSFLSETVRSCSFDTAENEAQHWVGSGIHPIDMLSSKVISVTSVLMSLFSIQFYVFQEDFRKFHHQNS